MDDREGCGILFHQRPMLQEVTDVADPMGTLFFLSWVTTPDETLSDESIAAATAPLGGQNLVFLKALVDGRPEILNVELPEGEFLRADAIREAPPVICVHYTNDPQSGFYCREVRNVKVLAPIRGWKLHQPDVAEGDASPRP
jgi:hypothetical protein